MSYQGWAILSNGKWINDNSGAVGPALFATRREAQAWWNVRKVTALGGKVMRVTVTVKEVA